MTSNVLLDRELINSFLLQRFLESPGTIKGLTDSLLSLNILNSVFKQTSVDQDLKLYQMVLGDANLISLI